MMTTLTDQDVRDAFFAYQTNRLAHAEQTTPHAIINELTNTRREADEQIAQYERGATLLKNYSVLTSDRSVVGGRFDAETLSRVVSPIVSVSSGHIATSEAYRNVALAQR